MPFPSDKTNQSRQKALESSSPAYKTHNRVKSFLKHAYVYTHFYVSTNLEKKITSMWIATTLIFQLDAGEFWRDNSIDASNDFLKCYNE